MDHDMEVRRVIPPDAIESIDEPSFSTGYGADPADRALVLHPEDGPARAYPVLILNYHEIVNDVIDGEPIAVTWCPLCGSAVVYDRTVDGRELTFGVSGKLAEDDLVMYDRETGSEWKQSLGECISGRFEGRTLDVRPASMLTVARFFEEYPDGFVLDPPDGDGRVVVPDDGGGGLTTETRAIDYTIDHYADYVESDWLGSRSRPESRTWNRTDVAAKDVVLGVEADGDALAVPRSRMPESGVLRVTVGGADVVVLAADGDLHAYEDPGFGFDALEGGRYAGDGTAWDGGTGRADDGRSLVRVPARRMFAFAWQADHGPDAFYLAG